MNAYLCVSVCAYIYFYIANINFTYGLLNNFYESIALGVQACHIYSVHIDLQSWHAQLVMQKLLGGAFLEKINSLFFLYFLHLI